MKVMKVVLTALIYLPLYGKLLTYITFLAWNTRLSTQWTLHPTVPLPSHLTVHHKLQTSVPLLILQLRYWPYPDYTSACSDSSDEKEDFQMVPLDDKHWTSEEVPERPFCIHEHGLPHNLCQYPCPYGSNDTVSYIDSLDLSDISDYEDYMVTSSDEELLGMEEVPYWRWTLVCLNTYLKFQF